MGIDDNFRAMKHLLLTTIAAVLLVGCATTLDYSKPRPLKAGEARIAKKKRNIPPSETSIAIGNAIGGIWDFLMKFGTGSRW